MSEGIFHIALEPGPNRVQTVTQKIDGSRTGFAASVFLHVDNAEGKIVAIRLSNKGKDGSTLDLLFHAIGDELSDMVRQVQTQGATP